MAIFKPFRAYRPLPNFAKAVASRPYDVLSSAEAKTEAAGNPHSFLRVIKPEIELNDDINQYSDEVYQKGAEVFKSLISDGVFKQDDEPSFYVYRLTMDGRQQTGLVGCCHFEEYYSGKIKKHELTRTAKEDDRVRHVDSLNANAEPVFFSYRSNDSLEMVISEVISADPKYNFIADDGIQHELWVIGEESIKDRIESLFLEVPDLYVADGHHRTAAAARIGKKRKENNPTHTGDEAYNFFMAVLFSDNQLKIYDYNRVIKDLNGLTAFELIGKLNNSFKLLDKSDQPIRPSKKGEFSVYLDKNWYHFAFPDQQRCNDPTKNLDVSYLSEEILEPLFDIMDQRKDERIDFVGGIRGLGELERRVDSGEMAIAFALYPVSMDELLEVADAGKIMPPKSTWFEPKLRSGLFVHELD